MKTEGLENYVEHKEEEKQYIERVREVYAFLETIADKLKEKNVPITSDCRIDSLKYQYSDKEDDLKKVDELKKEFYEYTEKDDILNKKLKTDGEQLEILTTIILHKKLSPRFIVTRTSEYDDFKNGVDHIIFDTKTNTPVCAFDEVSSTEGKEFQKKQKKTVDRNTKESGVNIKYGLTISDGKITQNEMKNVPILYLAFPKNRLRSGIKDVNLSLNNSSKSEDAFFTYFKAIVTFQKESLNFSSGNKNSIVKNKLEHFQKALGELSN